MAITTVSDANVVKQWENKYFLEYVRKNRFAKYMGTNTNSIIHLNERLSAQKGDTVNIPLVTRLKGAGVTGNSVLEGNEEALGNFNHGIVVDTHRHAVAVTDHEEQMTAIQLRNAAKAQLQTWSMELLRDRIITALGSVNGVAYGDATQAQLDNWLADNADRVLFGASVGNNASNDHSASLANVDATDDTLSPGIVSLARRRAQDADPHIRPYRTDDDEEWYVMFTGTRGMRDLKNDPVMMQANREAWQRASGMGKNNPIFRPGDLIYDGVIIREVPEIGVLAGVGAGSPAIDVQPSYLCGAQALGVAWAKRPTSRTDVRDYGFVHGVAIHEMSGVDKLQFVPDDNAKIDHGVVTVFTAGVADA